MKVKRSLVITTLVILAGIMALSTLWERSEFFITKSDFYRLRGMVEGVRVFEDTNGLYNAKVVRQPVTFYWSEGQIDPGRDWFVYVETPDDIWVAYNDRVTYL